MITDSADTSPQVHHHSSFGNRAAQLIFLFNLIWSRFRGPIAPDNPWRHFAGMVDYLAAAF